MQIKISAEGGRRMKELAIAHSFFNGNRPSPTAMIEEIAAGKYAICDVEELKKLAKELINCDRYFLAETVAAMGGFPLEENPTIIKIKEAIADKQPFRISYLDAARRPFSFDCAYAQISTYENKQYLEVNYLNDVDSDSPPPLGSNRILRLSRIPYDSQILKLDTEWKDLNYLAVKFRLSGNLAAAYTKKNNDIVTATEDGVIVERKISNDFFFVRKILQYGEDCVVLAPDAIVDKIIQRFSKCLINYQTRFNPYIIGDPVTASLFVGREDIIRQLVEIWGTAKQLQSVVLHGNHRSGKTSILLNLPNWVDAKVKVVYVNLMCLGSVSDGLVEVLMAISDAISDALNVPPPDDVALQKFPERTFKNYLRSLLQKDDDFGLIIALDEFEIIEQLIKKEQISPNFLAYLRSLTQMIPSLAFIFAGLHTLEEMRADYFQPFFGSVIPIRVSFLSQSATSQILGNPDPAFSLNYTGQALERIYNLTRGQPFLVQVIGWNLVRLHNDRVFEQEKKRSATFTLEDVDAVINKEFFSIEKYYFTGIWNRLKKEIPKSESILKALAPHPEGLTEKELSKINGLENSSLISAINTLKKQDIIEETNSRYRIIIELFRLWIHQYS